MRFRLTSFFALTLAASFSFAQELFPLSEPASSVPKGVWGVRVYSQSYKEIDVTRSLHVLRVMYGVTPRLSLIVNGSISNHHDDKLPPDLITHNHIGGGTNFFTQNIKRGVKYAYLFNGIHAYAKYRFLSLDSQNKHFRMAAYGEWSNVGVAHDEAEPNLMEDTGGFGFGVISTYLKNRFAVSIVTGFVNPNSYSEMQPDLNGDPNLPNKPDLPTKIYYANAFRYSLSFGYRLAPEKYTDYDQPNWNIYVELMGQKYNSARVIQDEVQLPISALALQKGGYMEIHPGIQRIIKSNLRLDFSVGFNFIGNSFVRIPPIWTLGVQRYFF
ncbi:MAG: hypothetical protein JXR03_15540 [Cyclobacteriaceae bacterium]